MLLNKKIVIFGAGIAGLSTAYYLKKEGYKPVVYEKRPEAGGRFATLQYEDVYINKGAMMFAPELNSHFTELISELGVSHELIKLKKFALQIDDKITGLDSWSMFRSGLFSLSEYMQWRRLKKFIKGLDFRLESWDPRLQELHSISLEEFCVRDMGYSKKMLDYIVQPFSSFGYIDPPHIAADHGLFLLAYGDTPIRVPHKGMAEVAAELVRRMPGVVKTEYKIESVKKNSSGMFDINLLGPDGRALKEAADNIVFATGQESLGKIMPEINFYMKCTKTRGIIFEAQCPQYRKYDVLLFSKFKNSHGVHGGEMKHLPDGRTIAGMFLYRPDADIETVFGKYKELPRVGWSPAITLIPPASKTRGVETEVPGDYIVGDFYRLPCIESCVYTAKQVVKKITTL
ncbi:MAG: FAD-dependent oxidoreductase [Nitrospirota bacterium]